MKKKCPDCGKDKHEGALLLLPLPPVVIVEGVSGGGTYAKTGSQKVFGNNWDKIFGARPKNRVRRVLEAPVALN